MELRKQTTVVIETCAKCPYIRHEIGAGYYCGVKRTRAMIPLGVNILKEIWEECVLEDYGVSTHDADMD